MHVDADSLHNCEPDTKDIRGNGRRSTGAPNAELSFVTMVIVTMFDIMTICLLIH